MKVYFVAAGKGFSALFIKNNINALGS